ncbi:MAG: hypothetical protein RLZZ455_1013 [Candidatus Parcubacteria bacterium]
MTDLSPVTLQVSLVAKAAGDLALTYLAKGFSTHSKGGADFATEADDAVDAFLRKELSQNFPGTDFLTEETAPDEYVSFIEKERLWVIDPIDGTTNFSRGSTHFAISIALVEKGRPVLGVVYLPLEQKLYSAERNTQSSRLNDLPIQVSQVSALQEALVCCDWSWEIEKRTATHQALAKILSSVRAVECRGSAASDIASVASGNIDAYFNYGLKPWDCAAALLIAEKAGAGIMSLQGNEWSVFSPDLLVTNGKIDAELHHYFL